MAIGVGVPIDTSGLTVNIGNYASGTQGADQRNMEENETFPIAAGALKIKVYNVGLTDITVVYGGTTETIKRNDAFIVEAFSNPEDQTVYFCAAASVTTPNTSGASASVYVYTK